MGLGELIRRRWAACIMKSGWGCCNEKVGGATSRGMMGSFFPASDMWQRWGQLPQHLCPP